MKKPLERDIKKSILEWLTFQKNTFAWPNDSVGIYDVKKKLFLKKKSKHYINGVADILGIYNGKPLAIEVKRKGNYPTSDQKDFLKKFSAHGGIAIVAYSIEDVAEAFLYQTPNKGKTNDDSKSS